MEPIWRAHWPEGIDEAAIRLPTDPLPVILKRQARRVPGKAALMFYGREVSFGELDDLSDRFAGWLRARALRPGDRVAIRFGDALPKAASGKILKRALREQARAAT